MRDGCIGTNGPVEGEEAEDDDVELAQLWRVIRELLCAAVNTVWEERKK